MIIRRFDQVRLRTARNTRCIFMPPGTRPDPNCLWSVAGTINEELLLINNDTIICAPASDVFKAVGFDSNKLMNTLGKLSQVTLGESNGKAIEADQTSRAN